MTAGLGNPALATGELFGAVTASVLALLVPFVCLALVAVLVVVALRKAGRAVRDRRAAAS